MDLFSNSDNNNSQEIDYNRLRKDFIYEDVAQMAVFSGAVGFAAMCDGKKVPKNSLLKWQKEQALILISWGIGYYFFYNEI